MNSLKTQFNALDVDGDGKLSTAELRERLMHTCGIQSWHADFLMQTFDADYDGQLNRDEFVNMLDALFG